MTSKKLPATIEAITAATLPIPKDDALERTVTLCREGLLVDGAVVPMIAGAVHYWRMDPEDWRPALEATRALGVRIIDVYVPWDVHEIEKKTYDFGTVQPRNDVVRFLRIMHELGLHAALRPGPHINAELSWFGIPKRVLWDPRCQARSPRGAPVVLPVPPVAFPVPSLASEAFLKQTTKYFKTLGTLLAPLMHPHGPIVMVQVDNEATLYFRDGVYDQDWHDDALALYRKFISRKYGAASSPRTVYGIGQDSFEDLQPPRRFEATSLAEMARHLDWAELQEHLVTRFLRRTGKRLRKAGFAGLPTSHNLPIAEHTSPAPIHAIGDAVDLLGLDYYYVAGAAARRAIARRTSMLALRCDVLGLPAFACELGAGFPFFLPTMTDRDNAFTALTAMAYGLRGFSIYMVVERDRWIGAPIDVHGVARPVADFWRNVVAMMDRTRFASLRRSVPVRVVTSRAQARIERVMHAFGPMSGAAFAVLGSGPRERCFEDELGSGEPIALSGAAFLDAIDQALEAQGIPFAHAWDDDPRTALYEARWVIVATPGGVIEPSFLAALDRFAREGGCVTFGPNPPQRTPELRPLEELPDMKGWTHAAAVPLVISSERAAIDEAIRGAIAALGLSEVRCDPGWVHRTDHVDAQGRTRLVFLVNEREQAADVVIDGEEVCDAMTGEVLRVVGGVLTVCVAERSVRVLQMP